MPAKTGLLPLVLALLTSATLASAQLTTRTDAVGKLLNEWHTNGRAAGLAGITYENRDGGHSPFNNSLYPQLQVFKHGPETGSDKGPAQMLRKTPTVGNCSMAAPAMSGGSLPRFYQISPKGTQFLMMQYVSNQMFIYPEHQDYDIGANGIGGYGDLYPVNNATVLISQGSSGSDQPFLNAIFATISALPPETQEVLVQKRILMPTVQAIFRQSTRLVVKDEDYFTGAAHPPVFDAAQIHEEAMVRAAHAMTPAQIPPLVQIEVKDEMPLEAGRHYFEGPGDFPVKLADTPVSVARILRGNVPVYEMTVSAAKAADLMRRPLEIRWQVLNGDPKAVEITPDATGRTARLRLRWQGPYAAAGSGIRSHRVDIGVFASNGIAVSTPAFLSFYHLPNEKYFHDAQGRVTEAYYQAHNPDLGLPVVATDGRWLKVMLAASIKGDGLKSQIMERVIPGLERDAIQKVWLRLSEQERALPAGDAARRAEWEASLAAALLEKLPGDSGLTLRQRLETALQTISEIADLYPTFQRDLDKLAAASPKATAAADVRAEVKRLIDLGVLIEEASGAVSPVTPADRMSPAERYYLSGLNLTLLSHVLLPEALDRSTAPAWTDPRLTTPKPWRDVYRYDPESGELLGWTRHGRGRAAVFNAQGQALPEGFKKPEISNPVEYVKTAGGELEWRLKP